MLPPVASTADTRALEIEHVIELLPHVAGVPSREQQVRETIEKYAHRTPYLNPVYEARNCILYRTRHPVSCPDWATTYECWMHAEAVIAREVRGVA